MNSRRDFLTLLGMSATTAALSGLSTGCGKRRGGQGAATSAKDVAAVLPKYQPIQLLKPDISGEGAIPDGYLKYPTALVRAIADKPSSGGPPIKSMSAMWGPTPPGLGRNAYLDAVNAELGIAIDPNLQDGNTYADKLSAILGARDVPDLLSAPAWEIDKIPRFSQAAKALFADLTEYLKGDAIEAYPMLATLPTAAWQHSVWGGRLAAVPYPTDGPFPWMLYYRKDICDSVGLAAPKTLEQFYDFGKKMTNPQRGVWAFGAVFEMVQMFFKCPACKTGWRKKSSGGLEFKYEIPEYRQALEFTRRLYKDRLVHPDVLASKGADTMDLFNAGRLIATQNGGGSWRNAQSQQSKITPGYNIQPMPIFSAVGGDPLAWGGEAPIFYTFVKKGLSKARIEELLRVLNWLAAPFGSREYELNQYGVEGKHFTRASDHSPIATDLGQKEIGNQYGLLGGRFPAVVGTADVPSFVQDLLSYSRTTIKYLEPDLFKGIKVELPANYSRLLVTTEDKMADIQRGRRPLGDLDTVVREWRNSGGDEGRAFLEKTLADNGR